MGPNDCAGAFDAVAALTPESTLPEVRAAAQRVARVRARCDAADVTLAALIEELSPEPEHDRACDSVVPSQGEA